MQLTLITLPVLILILPLTTALGVFLPPRYTAPVLTLGGLAFGLAAGGFPSLLLMLCAAVAGWMFLHVQPPAQQKNAMPYLTAGYAVQFLILMLGRWLLSDAICILPLLLCAVQNAGFQYERAHYRTDIPGLSRYLCLCCALPRLLTGPILTAEQAQTIRGTRKNTAQRTIRGAMLLTAGLFESILLALPVLSLHQEILAQRAIVTAADAWCAMTVSVCGLLCTLTGLRDIGRGTSLLLGFEPDGFISTPARTESLAGYFRRRIPALSAWVKRLFLRDGLPFDHAAYAARMMLLLGTAGVLVFNSLNGLFFGTLLALMLTAERMLAQRGLHPPKRIAPFAVWLLLLIASAVLQGDSLTTSFSCLGSLLGINGFLPGGAMKYLLTTHWLPLLTALFILLPLRRAGRYLVTRFLRRSRAAAYAALVVLPLTELTLLLLCLAELMSRYAR